MIRRDLNAWKDAYVGRCGDFFFSFFSKGKKKDPTDLKDPDPDSWEINMNNIVIKITTVRNNREKSDKMKNLNFICVILTTINDFK